MEARKSTKHATVEAAILEKYGEQPPGTRLPSELELAAEFGVSRITIVRALNDLRQAGHVERKQGRGTTIAGGRRREPTGIVGLLGVKAAMGLGFSSTFQSLIERGIQQVLFGGDYGITTYLARKISDGAIVEPETFARKPIDGLITLGIMNPDYMKRLLRSGLPVVGVEYHFEDLVPMDFVVEDCEASTHAAARMLIEQGHRRIAFFGKVTRDINPVYSPEQNAMERAAGLRRAFHEAALPPPEDLIACERHWKSPLPPLLKEMFSAASPPTAFIVHSADTKELLRFLKESGRPAAKYPAIVASGPEDLTVEEIRHCWTINQDLVEMGRVAARRLLERIRDPQLPPKLFKNPWWMLAPGKGKPMERDNPEALWRTEVVREGEPDGVLKG